MFTCGCFWACSEAAHFGASGAKWHLVVRKWKRGLGRSCGPRVSSQGMAPVTRRPPCWAQHLKFPPSPSTTSLGIKPLTCKPLTRSIQTGAISDHKWTTQITSYSVGSAVRRSNECQWKHGIQAIMSCWWKYKMVFTVEKSLAFSQTAKQNCQRIQQVCSWVCT